MSGRKASEVNSLLRNATKTRSNSINVLDDIYNKIISNTKIANDKAMELKEFVNSKDYEICEEAKKEFSKNAENLQVEIEHLQSKVNKLSFEANDKQYSSLLEEYEKVDSEADIVRNEVRRKIKNQGRNDPWYCDEEFAHAKKVQEKYKKLAEQAKYLNNNFSGKVSSISSALQVMDEYKQQAIRVEEAVADLNVKAKKLVQMRAEATSARKEIADAIESIDSGIAEKFLANKYKEITKKNQNYQKLSDKEVVETFTEMTNEIIGFSNSLQALYAEYLEKKSLLKGQMDAIKERIDNKVYSEPKDEYKQGEKEMFSLVGFIDKHGDTKKTKEIFDELSKCEKFFQNDDFEETNKSLEILTNLVDKVANEATLIHENRMKTIMNMLSIKKAMIELGYDVNVIENEIVEDGYCIECTAGEECIKFDKVTVINEGEPIITIDHKEATNGTCAASWHEIRKKLSDEGIFIEDITKNGKTIHVANSQYKTEAINQRMVTNK